MYTKNTRHMELSIGKEGQKNLQSSRVQRIFETPKNVSRYLVTTRATGIGCMNKVHRNFPMVGDGKVKWHIGSREFIGEYLRHLPVKQTIIWKGGSPGGKYSREPRVRVGKIC